MCWWAAPPEVRHLAGSTGPSGPVFFYSALALFAALANFARGLGRRHQLLGNFLGLFRVEVEGQLEAVARHIDAHHALIGGADLQIAGDVAFLVDTHLRLRFGLILWAYRFGPRPASPLDREGRIVAHGAMTQPPLLTLAPLAPGDAGWVIERHGALYAAEEGYDARFEALVARVLAEFLEGHDPACERGFIAWAEGRRLGSVFVVREGPGVARLRLFLLEPQARGLGLGRRMLAEALAFARGAGYRRMVLWTHESHAAACALYEATGWQLTARREAEAFGQAVVDLEYEINL